MKKSLLLFVAVMFTATAVFAQTGKPSLKTPRVEPVSVTLNSGSPSGVAVAYINEGFEDTLFPPPGWTATTTAGTVVWAREYGFSNTGNASALADYSTPANEKWLITPQFSVASGDSLSFWIRRQYTVAYPPDSLHILISTTNANLTSFTNTLVKYDVANGLANAWTRYALSLNAFAGQNIYIAFKHMNTDGNGFNMDDVHAGANIVPVELVSFAASTNGNAVDLSWATSTETNNYGFEIERKAYGGEFSKVAFINGNGTSTKGHSYSFRDEGLELGKYTYRLKQLDFDGRYEYSQSIEADVVTPANYSLAQNFPNPFNPATTISFALKADAKVTLKLYDALGKEVKTLVQGNLAGGQHRVDVTTEGLSSGIYLYTIDAAGIDGSRFTATKKMMLMK